MARLYSTGPMENTKGLDVAGEVSRTLFVKVLNNNEDAPVSVELNVFALNGPKRLVGQSKFGVLPLSSAFHTFDVGDLLEFEVQVRVGDPADGVLVSVWGQDGGGTLVAAHRVLHQEMSQLFTA